MLETKSEIKTVINAKFDKIEVVKYQDETNKKYALKKQLDLLWQDFLEKNKAINHLFEEYKSLLQATLSPWLPQNSHNENSNINKNSPLVFNSFKTPTKNPPQTPKNNGEVPPKRLIINNQQECFSKKQRKTNLENQLVDVR